jgi:phage gpG-like protein
MPNKFKIDQILKNVDKIKNTVPPLLANQARNFFLESFKQKAWRDGTTENWKEVQRRIQGTKEYKYPKTRQLSRRTSPILVRTGKLRRAVRNSVRQQTFNKIELVVPLNYAAVHNEGLPMKNGDKMPRRRFMGESKRLNNHHLRLIEKEFDKVWKV